MPRRPADHRAGTPRDRRAPRCLPGPRRGQHQPGLDAVLEPVHDDRGGPRGAGVLLVQLLSLVISVLGHFTITMVRARGRLRLPASLRSGPVVAAEPPRPGRRRILGGPTALQTSLTVKLIATW